MESCRTCRFVSIMKQECRRNPPQAFMVPTQSGPGIVGVFPSLADGAGCGAHEPADAGELARREEEAERNRPVAGGSSNPEPSRGPRLVT